MWLSKQMCPHKVSYTHIHTHMLHGKHRQHAWRRQVQSKACTHNKHGLNSWLQYFGLTTCLLCRQVWDHGCIFSLSGSLRSYILVLCPHGSDAILQRITPSINSHMNMLVCDWECKYMLLVQDVKFLLYIVLLCKFSVILCFLCTFFFPFSCISLEMCFDSSTLPRKIVISNS